MSITAKQLKKIVEGMNSNKVAKAKKEIDKQLNLKFPGVEQYMETLENDFPESLEGRLKKGEGKKLEENIESVLKNRQFLPNKVATKVVAEALVFAEDKKTQQKISVRIRKYKRRKGVYELKHTKKLWSNRLEIFKSTNSKNMTRILLGVDDDKIFNPYGVEIEMVKVKSDTEALEYLRNTDIKDSIELIGQFKYDDDLVNELGKKCRNLLFLDLGNISGRRRFSKGLKTHESFTDLIGQKTESELVAMETSVGTVAVTASFKKKGCDWLIIPSVDKWPSNILDSETKKLIYDEALSFPDLHRISEGDFVEKMAEKYEKNMSVVRYFVRTIRWQNNLKFKFRKPTGFWSKNHDIIEYIQEEHLGSGISESLRKATEKFDLKMSITKMYTTLNQYLGGVENNLYNV